MKLFRVRGGVHPDYRKELSSEKATVPFPLPKRLYMPLQQHIGAPAEPLVAIGDRVLKGQMIARGAGAVSAPVHAPTSGVVADIGNHTAPHPSGLPQRTIVIEPDGEDEWAPLPEPVADHLSLTPADIARRVAEAGIVGLGGATFPSAVKLDLRSRYKLDILLVNGAECEPYLTCDDRLMREHADEVMDGVRIMAYALEVQTVLIAIEDNKPQALAAMTRAAAGLGGDIRVVGVPVRYPMGSERHLTLALTGRETPARKLTADIGVVVHNVATARAVSQAIRSGRPLISRLVTVSGSAIAEPKNIEVPLGVQVSELIAFCGGLTEQPRRIISGGPMMGQPLPTTEVPVIKGTSGILALTHAETNEKAAQPCIRCGTCVTACPCGLVPVEMAAFIRKDNLDGAQAAGVLDCVSCGSCSYVCPSHIPLVHYFNYAKGRINALERDKRKRDLVKKLVEARAERMERLAKAKREALAAKKAAAEAAKAAKAAAEAAKPAEAPVSEDKASEDKASA
ncbi:MAG: electron transport complex subunit RsxC [Pseudomonadota bacterium]